MPKKISTLHISDEVQRTLIRARAESRKIIDEILGAIRHMRDCNCSCCKNFCLFLMRMIATTCILILFSAAHLLISLTLYLNKIGLLFRYNSKLVLNSRWFEELPLVLIGYLGYRVIINYF